MTSMELFYKIIISAVNQFLNVPLACTETPK